MSRYKDITYEEIKNNEEIKTYIRLSDQTLSALGYTEHSFAHVVRTATVAHNLLEDLKYPERDITLVSIAAYMHDIGNVVNRQDHAQTGAILAFKILSDMNMNPTEIATIISAIGHHDESTAAPVNPIAAALILADKSDVRRSRVRNPNQETFDIHDRVNFAVKESSLRLTDDHKSVILKIKIDTDICPVMDYFEIFLNRMQLCKQAAHYLNIWFKLIINQIEIL